MNGFFFVALLALLPLPLPPFFTVTAPFDTIAADIENARAQQTIALWRSGARIDLPPVPPNPRFGNAQRYIELGALHSNGALFAMRATPFSGAYTGTAYDVLRRSGNSWTQIPTGGCNVGYSVGHVERIEDDGTLDMTYESPMLIVMDEAQTGMYAPYAVRLRTGSCQILGRFNLRGLNGHFAVGYRGYLYGALAPTNLNVDRQRYVAVRYHARHVTEIGPGEAFAVAADGTAAGSDAPPMHWNSCCSPHAVLWDMNGHTVALAPHARESVAYAIDARHRVVGELLGRDGRHYAFLWERGRLHLLDDIAHVAGWRFEGAFRFTSDGSIVGCGTHDGIASAFELPFQDWSKNLRVR